MDNGQMDRLAAWLTRQSPKRLGYMGKLKWAGMPAKHLLPISWALYRRQYGLEARALVALVMAPEESFQGGRRRLVLRQLLTPAYAALAAILLDDALPSVIRERARADLSTRTYMPSGEDHSGWAAEAENCVAELEARRARWDARARSQVRVRRAG